ncbi:MAG TPA: hypothetical protein VEI48_08970 [Candidatus Sulfotelmatobacter sp.]|nr:hypothetical protein [Candidatus Sulfotelmatobacter sp.]
MSRSSGGRVVAALIAAVVAIALAVGAYSLGVSAGAASTGTVSAAPAFVGWHLLGWFLFFPFGFLFFILFIGLIVRLIFWGGRGGHYGHRHWGDGPGSRLDEWHRQAHAQGPVDPDTPR